MATKTFAEQITFSRATTATFVGSNGLIQTAAVNAPRFDYDPITLAAKGLLVEESRTNLSTQSAAFNAAEWQQVAVTITPNVVTAPDGAMTADLVVPSAALENKRLTNVAVTDPKLVYTFSCFAKMQPGGYEIIELAYGATAVNGSNRGAASFNLNTGVLNTTGNSGAAVTHSAKIDRYPDGWYRCSVTFTATTGTETQINWQVMPRPPGVNSTVVPFEANGTSGAYIWGAQVELGSNATSYIPTTTAQVTRAADVANITGTNFSQNYNAAEGTIYAEFEPLNQAVGSVALSLNDGTLNNAIRMQSKQPGTLSSIRMMASNGVTDVYAVSNAGNNVLRYNGVDTVAASNTVALTGTAAAHNGTDTFLTVGANGSFTTSPDGVAYTNRSIEGNEAINGGIFGAGKFVFGASLGFRISTDGITWRRVNVPEQVNGQNEVAYNGTDRFVSVGNAGSVYFSLDNGETWTLSSIAAAGANNLVPVTFGAGLFVTGHSGTNTNNIYTSSDGVTWTTRTVPGSNSRSDIAYNGTNLFVAVGNAGSIVTSPDAVTWTSRTSGTAQNLRGSHFAAGQWVAVGDAGTVITSPDGITWTTRTSGTTQPLLEVNYIPFTAQALWVAVGNAGTIITSPDAITWTTRTSPSTSNYIGISHNGQTAVATGVSGLITSSTDGITWTARTGNNAVLNGAAFGNGTFVVVGNAANGSGVIATVDPVTGAYTRRVSGTASSINNVRFLANTFFACANSGGSYVLSSSTDGISWEARVIGGSNITDIAYNGTDLYVAVATSGNVRTSADGVNWSAQQLNRVTSQTINSLNFANGLFVGVAAGGVIITTTNGTEWTSRTSGTTATLRTVNYSTRDQLWYAAGDNGTFLSSPDGITWTPVANRATAAIFSGGTLQANPTLLPNFTPAVPNKMAISYKANDVKVSVNGQTSQMDTTATLPSLTQLSIGMNGVSGQQFNGYIRNLQLFPKAVTAAEIEAMTL